jgi:hypothetical protein
MMLNSLVRGWKVGEIKFVADLRREVEARALRRSGGYIPMDFLDSDEATIIGYMDNRPDFERATFANPAVPSWKRRS